MVYQQKKMLVATVTIPKPIATMLVLCSAASRVRFSKVSHTSASATRITTNMMRCMMMPPLSVEYSTSYPKDDDDLWGTRVRCTPSPMEGGCNLFLWGCVCSPEVVPRVKKSSNPAIKNIITLFNPKTLGCT